MTRRLVFIGGVIAAGALTACTVADRETSTPRNVDAWPRVENPVPETAAEARRIDELLSRMTLEEKVGQLMQAEIQAVTPEEIKRYHIGSVLNGGGSQPYRIKHAKAEDWVRLADEFYAASMDTSDGGVAVPVIWGTDAVHGHGNVTGATLFPHNSGLGATGNPALIRRIGEITAKEVTATGLDWVFSPTVAVAQDDRWGRTYESYSEDSERVARLSRAMVEGLQGRVGTPAFLDEHHVVAGAKHFIADGGTEGGDDQGNARITEQALIDLHNPGYVAAMEAGVQNIMASFSSWHGKKVHGSRYLLTEVLKERMGFGGFVVSDWNGHGQIPGCTDESCAQAVNAGIDMVMVTYDWKAMIENTLEQVQSGEISTARLDDAVRRILKVKLRAGLFGAGPSERANAGKQALLGHPDHRAVARRAVRQSLVLLKNRNGILPLDPGQTVLVAGKGADSIGMQSGGWSVNWQGSSDNADFPGATSIYQGIRRAVESRGGQVLLSPDGGYETRPDVAVVVFGEPPYAEGHGDLNTVEFEPADKPGLRLLQQLNRAGIPVVSVFIAGRPLWVNPELNASDAFVAAWLPGSEGAGVADVIIAGSDGTPRHDFKGRLPFSWPKTPLQGKLNPHHPDYDPLFPLGYGLTYAGAEAGPGELPEDVPGVASDEIDDIRFYDGRPLQPWSVFIRQGERTQLLNGAYISLADGNVVLQTTDKEIQEDALMFTWENTERASVFMRGGPPLDLSGHAADGVLAFDLNVTGAPGGELMLKMRCEPGCEKEVSLADYARSHAGEGWQRVAVKLSCFTSKGEGLARVSMPLALEATKNGEVSLADIRFLVEGEATLDCRD